MSGRDSGGSQWFMTLAPQPHLDDRYTIFGRIVSGLSVARSLLPGDRIENVSVERVMGPADRAEEDREVAEAMLAQLQANSDENANEKKKRKKKASKKKKGKKSKEGDEIEVVPVIEPEDDEASEDVLPDEHVKAEEDPDLIEGEKVDVIDPNQDD